MATKTESPVAAIGFAPQVARKRRFLARVNDRRILPRLLITPVQILMIFVLIIPLLFALYMSFTGWSPTSGSLMKARLIGLLNYQELLTDDPRFVEAIIRTLVLSVICLALEFTIGLGLAVVFLRNFRGKKLAFSLLLTPMMTMPVVVGYTFWMLFQMNGPINRILSVLLFTNVSIEWLKNGTFAFLAVVIMETWHWMPLFFLILLSGLSSLPENPIRAAVVLGASPWQTFWRIVLPMLRPIIIVALVIRGMEVFKLFDEIFLLTRGGPGTATETISLYIFKLAFNDFRLAYAASAAFIILILILVLIHLLLRPIRYQLLKEAA